MSVEDNDYIDAVAIDVDGKTLIMLLSDHLGWEDGFEFDHLDILQEKLRAYARFVQSEQYKDIYPGVEFTNFRIKIRFLYEMSENCIKYIDVARKQLNELSIEITTEIA